MRRKRCSSEMIDGKTIGMKLKFYSKISLIVSIDQPKGEVTWRCPQCKFVTLKTLNDKCIQLPSE